MKGEEQEKCSLLLCTEAVPIDRFALQVCDGDGINLQLSEKKQCFAADSSKAGEEWAITKQPG